MSDFRMKLLAMAAFVFLGVFATLAFLNGRQWEARAARVQRQVQTDNTVIDSLRHVAGVASAQAERVDTVRVAAKRRITVVDTASHPDSTCRQSTAIRDTVIAVDSTEIDHWRSAYAAESASARALTADRDSLLTVLRARPGAVSVALAHAQIQLSVQGMLYPQARIGIGVSVPLATIRLHL